MSARRSHCTAHRLEVRDASDICYAQDVTLLDEVRLCVRLLASRTEPWPSVQRLIDVREEYRLLQEIFDGLPDDRAHVAGHWSLAKVGRFAEWLVPQALFSQVSSIRTFFRAALRRQAAGEPVTGLSRPDTAELEDILSMGNAFERRAHWWVPVLYAEKLGLVRHGLVTPSGQMFESLPDRDARRWLLVLEMHLSLGDDDEWRVPRTHVQALIGEPSGQGEEGEHDADQFWPQARLVDLGYVSTTSSGSYHFYDVHAAELAELKATLDDSNPMWAVAKALGNDPAHVLLSAGLESPQELGLRSASRAAAEVGRTVAHELRNILLPIDASVSLLEDAVRGSVVDGVMRAPLSELSEHVKRLWRHADWFGQLGESLGRPPERFGARAALDEAVQRANGGRIQLQSDVPATATLFGFRDRFVLALLNLLRNAQQAGATRIEVNATVASDALQITVDDDGPGVPPDKVSQLFVSTFTTRGEGHGEGLALVRRIVEGDHLGRIGYAPSPLGGARFSVRVPL